MQKFTFTTKEKIFLILSLFVLIMLFASSSMTYHQQEMRPGFIHRYLGWLENIVGNFNIYYGGRWHNAALDGGQAGMTQFIVRKLAHFSSYFALGLFSFLGLKRIFRIKWVAPILTWLAVIGLAAFDEFHQFLTGDRTPSVHDVMLDGSGAFCAIILCSLVLMINHLYSRKKQDKSA